MRFYIQNLLSKRSWALKVLSKPWGHCKNIVQPFKLDTNFSFFLIHRLLEVNGYTDNEKESLTDITEKHIQIFHYPYWHREKVNLTSSRESIWSAKTPLVITFIITPVPKRLLSLSSNWQFWLSLFKGWSLKFLREDQTGCQSAGSLQPDKPMSKSVQ